jgi:hypothetical protein
VNFLDLRDSLDAETVSKLEGLFVDVAEQLGVLR